MWQPWHLNTHTHTHTRTHARTHTHSHSIKKRKIIREMEKQTWQTKDKASCRHPCTRCLPPPPLSAPPLLCFPLPRSRLSARERRRKCAQRQGGVWGACQDTRRLAASQKASKVPANWWHVEGAACQMQSACCQVPAACCLLPGGRWQTAAKAPPRGFVLSAHRST